MALVLGVIDPSIFGGSMLYVSGFMSTNTGFAPVKIIAFAVAIKVKGVVITSSPGPIPAAVKATIRALVPLSVATAYLVPQYLAKASSNSATFSPCASFPLFKTLTTAVLSSEPISGLLIGIVFFICVLILNFQFLI